MVVAKRMQQAVKNWARAAIKFKPKAMQQPFEFLLFISGAWLISWPSPKKQINKFIYIFWQALKACFFL